MTGHSAGEDRETTVEDLGKYDSGHVITWMPKPVRGFEKHFEEPYRGVLVRVYREESTKGNMPVTKFWLHVRMLNYTSKRKGWYRYEEVGPYPGDWPVTVGAKDAPRKLPSNPFLPKPPKPRLHQAPVKPVRGEGVVWTSETPKPKKRPRRP